MEEESQRIRKPQRIGDSEPQEHFVVFQAGKAVLALCPAWGECTVTGWRIPGER